MEILWFTLTGIMLYLVSDWIIRRIENLRGKPLANRGVIFFLIFLPLALGSFKLIRLLLDRS